MTSVTDYTTSNDRMISEKLETIWKEAIVAHFEILPDICAECLRKPTGYLSRVPADIRTGHLRIYVKDATSCVSLVGTYSVMLLNFS
jgi:hypothetical protein